MTAPPRLTRAASSAAAESFSVTSAPTVVGAVLRQPRRWSRRERSQSRL